MNAVSVVILVLVLIPLAYLACLALASALRARPRPMVEQPTHRFAIAIPAHDEASVIGATVRRLRQLDYPPDLFDIYIVADHCTDETASLARAAGATVYERNEGPRSGKGAALAWLFERLLAEDRYDAVVVFDSDTRVDRSFLSVMDARLAGGAPAVQGQHIISNPDASPFAALTWAMFLIDNRFQNLGRSNLGWSAKNMGDSICLRAAILRRVGWGEGLTEDYQLRQRLLLEGVKIVYEPAAKGYGEAATTWKQARAQRARWLRGTRDASQRFARRLLAQGLKRRDLAALDGALQAYLPSYSTLTLLSVGLLVMQLAINLMAGPVFSPLVLGAWAAAAVVLFVYPFAGLALERAPVRAYLAILYGSFFVVWRTWLALRSRFGSQPVTWVRTAHGERK